MKNLIYFISLLTFGVLLFLVSCGDDGEDPQPTSLKFTTASATFDGSAITPTPAYTITVNFDASGNATTYTATGSSRTTPTPGNAGSWSVAGSTITFVDNGGAQRTVNGSINSTSSSITLNYNVTKLDQGVITDEVGNYIFNMSAQ
jgi:hypothetical protein